jgi:hypothetical protein
MSPCTACHPQVVQATSDHHDHIRKALFRVAQWVFGNPTDFDAGNCVFDPNTRARQFAIVALLAGR